VESLLELEGFRVADYWGGFGKEQFGRGSRQQVVRALTAEPDPVRGLEATAPIG
jgi:hypothetical protein